jgi:hypothetical protein
VSGGPTHAALASLVLLRALCLLPLLGPGEPLGEDHAVHLGEVIWLSRALGDLDLWSPIANLGYPAGEYYPWLPQLLPAVAIRLLGDAVPALLVFKLAVALPLVLAPVTLAAGLRWMGLSPGEAVAGAAATTLITSVCTWGVGPDASFSLGLYPHAWGMLVYPLALGAGCRWAGRGVDLAPAVGWLALLMLLHPLAAAAVVPGLLVAAPRPGRLGALLAGAALLTVGAWLPAALDASHFGGFPHGLDARVRLGATEQAEVDLVGFWRLVLAGRVLDEERPPVLTALAAVALVSGWREARLRLLLLQALVLALVTSVGLAVGPDGALRQAMRCAGPLQVALASAAGVAAMQIYARLPVTRPTAVLLVLLTLPAAAARTHRWAQPVDPALPARRDLAAICAWLAEAPPGRVLAGPALGTGSATWLALPISCAGQDVVSVFGGAPFQSSSLTWALSPLPPRLWGLFGVRYALTTQPGARPLFTTPTAAVIAGPPSGALFAVASRSALPAEPSARRAALRAWLDAPITEHPRFLPGPDRALPGQLSVVEERRVPSGLVATLELAADGPSLIAARVSAHPGWRGWVDGEEVPVVEVAPGFPAIDVPPGTHRVELHFHRGRWALVLLGVGLGGIGVCLGWSLRPPARPRPCHGGEVGS